MSSGSPKTYRWLLFNSSLVLLVLVFFCVFITSLPVHAATGINQQINFQGRLLNAQGATVADGTYNIEFKIYQDGDGQSAGDTTGSPAGSLKWTEDYLNTNSQGVTVKNGYFSVQLGSITAFGSNINWNQSTLWLSVNIGGTGSSCTPFSSCSPDGEMLPMKRLAAAPYALNANQLGGLTSSQFIQMAQGLQTDTSTANTIYVNKTGGSGNLIDLQSNGSNAFILSNSGSITSENTTNSTTAFQVQNASASTVLDVDTSNQRVGIGTNAPGSVLTVTGVQPAVGNATDVLTVTGGTGAGTATAGNGGNITLTGGNGGNGSAANGNGGNITLSAGAAGTGAGSAGSAGSVIVKDQANSTTAFQVQNASSSTILSVDTTNKAVIAGSGLTLAVPNLSTPSVTTTGGSIANGTTYYYGVTALNGASETEISPIASVTVSSATSTNEIILNWTQSYSATGYKVYRNTTNNFTSGSLLLTTIGSGSTLTYTDTGSATSTGLPPSAYKATIVKVDSAANNPIAASQTAFLGSIYYNTTSGDFLCYKDGGVGGTWADCGVTSLQGAYTNGPAASTSPTIKLDSTRGTVNIQDANTSIGTDLVDVRASNSGGLGTLLFGVGSTGTVTVQDATDQNTLLRALNQSGQYLFNVNSANGYFITNTVQEAGNPIQNPGFEAGGNLTSGEEGWNGPAQGTIVNDNTNAHTGNYELQVTPNSTTIKIYAGTYYKVQPGEIVYFQGWVKNSATANGTAGVTIEGYDRSLAFVGSQSNTSTLPGTSYVLSSVSYTVPSSVSYVRLAAAVINTATTGTFYFDDLYTSKSVSGQAVFQNTSNSTTAFAIQSASAGDTLFTADTTNNNIKIGNSTGSDTATTILIVDSATANPTTNLSSRNGGLFYRSDTSNLEAILGGQVAQVCTTAVVCSGYSASATSSVQLQTGSQPGTQQTGFFNISGVGYMTGVQTINQSTASTNSNAITIQTGNASGTTSNSGGITIDVGTATGTLGGITIGHSGVATTIGGTLAIQGSSSLSLGTSSSATGSILFKTSAGANTVSLAAPGANPTSSYTLTLPQALSTSGSCLKDTGSGVLGFSNCGVGATVTLQNVYDNSSPANTTLADGKDYTITAQQTTTSPNIVFNLQCASSCGSNGRFAIQNSGTDELTVKPNSGGIILGEYTQIGSATAGSQVNLQLDSSSSYSDSGSCTTTTNQGALYYNTVSLSIRVCQNSNWTDLLSTQDLDLLLFGVVPDSGSSNQGDLPALITAGVSGPCKVSWASATSVSIQACTAYSGGRRVSVTAATLTISGMTTTNIWENVCLTGTGNQPALSTAASAEASTTSGFYPTFSVTAPILCLAQIKGSTVTANNIAQIYDTRAFSSTTKEFVAASTAVSLGMLVDLSGSNIIPTVNASQKILGAVIATNGGTSTTSPNAILNTNGPAWIKANAGSAGQFVIQSATNGYASTNATIPNNSFNYEVGMTPTAFSNTCTAASNCSGSLFVNFQVR